MNEMKLSFLAKMENESFARCSVIAFLMPMNLNTQQVMEIKTIISEGVSNAILHGYAMQENAYVNIHVSYDNKRLIKKLKKIIWN